MTEPPANVPSAPSGSAVEPAPLGGVPHRLWRLVALAHHRLLSLDHDGTLAPFVVARDRATPSPRSLRLLERIAGETRTTLAILSGRPLEELEARFGGLPAHLVGEYGWDRRPIGGERVRMPLPPAARTGLARAAALVREAGLGDHLEVKRTCLAVHSRGMPDEAAEAQAIRAEHLWRPLEAGGGLRHARFDGGTELRVSGRDKGTTIVELMGLVPPGALVVHLGDDESDEDAFEAIGDRGFGLRVGAPDRPTRAAGWLSGQGAVEAFLEAWLEAAGSGPPSGR